MEKKPSKPQVAEDPVAEVLKTAIRRRRKDLAENTLAPTLEKATEHAIGSPTGINVDEHGRARFTTISGVPSAVLYSGRSPGRLERGKISGLSRPSALHARHSRHGISR